MEKNELQPMLACTQPPVISQNLLDMAGLIRQKSEYVLALPRTEEGMKAVKAIRAQARKEFDQLETQRKEVKKAVLSPYEQAERLYKGFVTEPFKALDEACKGYVDEVEGAIKKECEDTLRQYFADLCAMKGLTWIKWERLGIKVDMATARLAEPKKAMETIKAFVDRVCADMEAISTMAESAEILAYYEQTLDIAEAIRRNDAFRKAAEVAKQNKEKWEGRAAQAAIAKEAVVAAEPGIIVKDESVKKLRCTFTVTASAPMLRALKAFLDNHNFEYTEVT